MKVFESLTEIVFGLILLIGIGAGASHLMTNFKKETFVEMKKMMELDLEKYTSKLTNQ